MYTDLTKNFEKDFFNVNIKIVIVILILVILLMLYKFSIIKLVQDVQYDKHSFFVHIIFFSTYKM